MGSLQSRKAKIKASRNGRGAAAATLYQIQVTKPDGRRTTLRLGAISEKAAREVARHVDHLVKIRKLGTRLDEETEAWLRSVDASLRGKLEALGLAKRSADPRLLGYVAKFIEDKTLSAAPRTIVQFRQVEALVREYFKGDPRLADVDPQLAKGFFAFLVKEKGNGENTARRRFGRVREIFNAALEEGLIRSNPFKLRSIRVSVGVGKKEYIEAERIERILPYFPSAEWRLLLAFGRFAGLRIPSEIEELRWSDVDWQRRTIRIRSPKTKHIGKGERTIPIFPELAPYLDRQWEELKEGSSEFVFASLRRHTNASTTAKKFVERAGETAWPAFWNSLRASCETDLMDRYGIRRACQWIGNTVSIAMKNYAQIKKTDFADLGGEVTLQSDAKSDAEGARIGEIGRAAIPKKPAKSGLFGVPDSRGGTRTNAKNPQKDAFPAQSDAKSDAVLPLVLELLNRLDSETLRQALEAATRTRVERAE